MSLLLFSGVGKCYPDGRRRHVVLEGVSFAIEAGEFVGVWGPRRSGKSTLLRIAAGIETPDQGAVAFDGLQINELSADNRACALRAGVGYVPAQWEPHYNRQAVDHVAFAAMADGKTTRRRARAAARRALNRVDMLECAERRLHSLSLGERVRVELARGLVREPRLLLIDEPPPLHSPREGDDLYDLLKKLGNDPDLAVLVACSDVLLIQQTRRMMSLGRARLATMTEPEPTPEPAKVLPLRSRRAASDQ